MGLITHPHISHNQLNWGITEALPQKGGACVIFGLPQKIERVFCLECLSFELKRRRLNSKLGNVPQIQSFIIQGGN